MRFHAAGCDGEIPPEIFARRELELFRHAFFGPSGVHEVDPPQPIWYGFAHMPEYDLEPRKAVEDTIKNETQSVRSCLDRISPDRSEHRIIAKRLSHSIRGRTWMQVDRAV